VRSKSQSKGIGKLGNAATLCNPAGTTDVRLNHIQAARRFGYLQIEALSHQLAARLYAGAGRQSEAAEKLDSARDCYRR
jgi:hypothetical protein